MLRSPSADNVVEDDEVLDALRLIAYGKAEMEQTISPDARDRRVTSMRIRTKIEVIILHSGRNGAGPARFHVCGRLCVVATRDLFLELAQTLLDTLLGVMLKTPEVLGTI